MRIGVIDVTRLTRVRRTFHRKWRFGMIALFLFFAYAFWAGPRGISRFSQITSNRRFVIEGLVLLVVFVSILGVAFFKKNRFARLTFSIITFFNLFVSFVMLLFGALPKLLKYSPPHPLATVVIGFFTLGIIGLLWEFFLAHGYVLFLSVIPFGRFRALGKQIYASTILWKGRLQTHYEKTTEEKGQSLYDNPGVSFRMFIGIFWLCLGFFCVWLGMLAVMHSDLLPELLHLQFAEAWQILGTAKRSSEWSNFEPQMREGIPGILVALTGLACFFLFGFFLHQWHRERLRVFTCSVMQHMQPGDILLLRPFGDDVKVVRRLASLWTVISTFYPKNYTFEQLIATRLAYIGKVRLLDIRIERLIKKWPFRVLKSDRLTRFMTMFFPALWYRLPASGGIRYYVDADAPSSVWENDVIEAMGRARLVVVQIGVTKSLNWEIGEIRKRDLLDKTIFLMPPNYGKKKSSRERWQRFISFLETVTPETEALKKMKPKRVLAVCVHPDTTLIITGRDQTQLYYQSALDLATIFTLAEPAESRQMVHRYLTAETQRH